MAQPRVDAVAHDGVGNLDIADEPASQSSNRQDAQGNACRQEQGPRQMHRGTRAATHKPLDLGQPEHGQQSHANYLRNAHRQRVPNFRATALETLRDSQALQHCGRCDAECEAGSCPVDPLEAGHHESRTQQHQQVQRVSRQQA
jgi:hypothetical protein